MEHAEFLNTPHQSNNILSIVSWNINGARTKLEQNNVYIFLSNFDIISINEVKSSLNISIPGYVPFKSKNVLGNASLRGGTVVMVRNYLANQVFNVDNSMLDQVWLQLECFPSIMFAFCYIPPTDSSYFSHNLFSNIQEKMSDFKSYKNVCIIGDLNARFGNSVRSIISRSNNVNIQSCSYPNIPDDIASPNDSAYILSSICVDNNLIVLNNVKTPISHFPSQKTFKRRNQWVSEIGTIVTSYEMINYVEQFNVHQTDWLPSNHAPISINLKCPKVNLDLLLTRA